MRSNLYGLRHPARTRLAALLSALLWGATPSTAQIRADQRAPGTQQPTVLSSANGTPQVNIQTPNAAGLSHNTYSQFDVHAQGAILNNSRTDSPTQLGGYVQGNPWLAAGSARIILNEVHSSAPSQLHGVVEVAGQRAEVIVANPAGIVVNGGGFINASGVTLSTGAPVLSAGNLQAHQVRGGSVVVQGLGLDSRTASYTTILARAVQINAGLWAEELRVLTGANDVAGTSAGAPRVLGTVQGADKRPQFALDVAALGGMYAGKIFLVGTEAGLGVNNAGLIAATAGDLVLTSDGWLSTSGTLQASGDTRISTQGDISASASSALLAGVDAQGKPTPGQGQLQIGSAGNTALHGHLSSGADSSISARALDLTGVHSSATNASYHASSGTLDLGQAKVVVPGTLQVSTPQSLRTEGAWLNAGALRLSAHALHNQGGRLEQTGSGELRLALAGQLDNRSGRIASNSARLQLSTARLDGAGGSIYSAGALQIEGGAIHLQNASTEAEHITLDATHLDNTGARIVQSGTTQSAQLRVSGELNNTDGRIVSNAGASVASASLNNTRGYVHSTAADLQLQTGALDNTDGELSTAEQLDLQVTSLNNSGRIYAAKSLAVKASNSLTNSGSIYTDGDLALDIAGKLDNSGRISTAAALTLDVNSTLTNTGHLNAANALVLRGRDGLNNSGSIYTDGDLVLDITAALTNTGTLAAHGNATLNAASLHGSRTSVLAAGLQADASLRSATAGSLQVRTSGAIEAHGQTLAAQDLHLQGASVDLNHSNTQAANITLLADSAGISTRGATVLTPGALRVQTQQDQGWDNSALQAPPSGQTATLPATAPATLPPTVRAGQLQVDVAHLDNAAAEIVQSDTTGVASIHAHTRLDNTGGRIHSNADLALASAGHIRNDAGVLSASQQISIDDSAAGTTGAGTSTSTSTSTGTGTAALRTLSISNAGGTIAGGDTTRIVAAGFSGKGWLLSQGDLLLELREDLHHSGETAARRNATIATAGALHNSGTLHAGNALSITADALRNDADAEIAAARTHVRVQQALVNRGLIDGGNSAESGHTRLQAKTLENLGSGRIYGDHISIAADTLRNDAEHVGARTTAATLGARVRLDVGASNVYNHQGASILSLGDLALGGALDGQWHASGQASLVSNSASTLQAQEALTMRSATIENLNPGLQWSRDGGTRGVSGTVYVTAAGSWDTRHGAVLATKGPLVPVPSGGYAFRETYVTTCGQVRVADHEFPQGCKEDSDLTNRTRNVQGQAQASAGDNDPHVFESFRTYYQTDYKPVVTASTPGTISSGAGMDLQAALKVVNDHSIIVAGGELKIDAPVIDNRARSVTLNALRHNTIYNWDVFKRSCNDLLGSCNYVHWAYRRRDETSTVPATHVLDTAVQQSYSTQLRKPASPPGPLSQQVAIHTKPPAVAVEASTSTSTSTTVQPVAVPVRSHGKDLQPGQPGQSGQSAHVPAAPATLSTPPEARARAVPSVGRPISSTPLAPPLAAPAVSLPTSSLYRLNAPASRFVVETDARFTSRERWLSSDYITEQLALAPEVTQKRLGDGYYEQQNIRAQVAELTGRRFLGDYRSDQEQYRALMNAGLTFARTHALRPGIRLSAAQIARLTSDIVWLQQEDVALPDGSTTQALVARLYARPRAGDLTASGALLGGASVTLSANEELRNSGTLQGRSVVQITAKDIRNEYGQIGAHVVKLHASQDLHNTGGSIAAEHALTLQADRNLYVRSTTQQSTGGSADYRFSHSGIDRLAHLHVGGAGTLLVKAGNTIELIAARVHGGADVSLQAHNNLVLHSVQGSESHALGVQSGHEGNKLEHHEGQALGTQITAGKDLQLRAGQNLYAHAASLSAQGAATLEAGSDLVLDAGQRTSSHHRQQSTRSAAALASSTTTVQQRANAALAQVSRVQGDSVSVKAGRDLYSVGAQLSGTQEVQTEAGKRSLFTAATNTRQSTTTVSSTTSALGLPATKGENNYREQEVSAQGSRLESHNRVRIGVGSEAILQGSSVQAPQIVFARVPTPDGGDSAATAPPQAPRLELRGSTSTESSSSEHHAEMGGVWQESAGKGSVHQTFNPTTLQGAVTFDPDLQITVELPQSEAKPGAQAKPSLQEQIQALQASQPGLEYLSQLSANPAVQWDKVELIHQDWNYQQQGLTPAGAMLLSIAVSAAAPGLGSSLSGSLGAASGSVAAKAIGAGVSSLVSQAAVALVNNGGDIGKTLQQLGSEQSIKNLLQTMATAGALEMLGGNVSINGTSLNNIGTGSSYLDLLSKNVINNVAASAMDAALNGKPFQERDLAASFRSALISTGAAKGAHAIGDAATASNDQPARIDKFTQTLAHLVLGCAVGAASAENAKGCAPGAVGAAAAELAAQYYMENRADADLPPQQNKADALGFARLVAGVGGILAGGGGENVQAVEIAASTGANAAANNYLAHAEALRHDELQGRKDRGRCDASCDAELAALKELDERRDKALDQCRGVQSESCETLRRDVRYAAAEYVRKDVGILNNTGTLNSVYQREKYETKTLVEREMDGLWRYKAVGAGEALVQGAKATGELALKLLQSVANDQQAQQELREGAAAAWDYYVNHPENLTQLIGDMSPEDLEAYAQAYERGDGEAAGKLYGAWLLNLPLSPAGPPGKLAKLGTIVKPETGGKAAQTVVPGAGAKITQAPNGSTAGTGATDANGGSGGTWPVSGETPSANVVSQATPTGCGAACGQMLLADRGVGVSQVALGGELTSAQSVASKLNAVDSGWTGAAVDTSSFAALNKTGSWSAMMWEPGASVGHWVVVDGLDTAGNVVIRDPAGVGTTYTMTVDAFKNTWNGFSVFKKP